MKKAILGTKVGMTQMFREDGTMIPVTVVLAGPCPVVQKKTVEHDGYEAVQVAFKPIREKLCTKPMLGHFKKAGQGAYRYTREFKLDDTAASPFPLMVGTYFRCTPLYSAIFFPSNSFPLTWCPERL